MAWPQVVVEIGFGSDPASEYLVFDDADRGLFDTATFGPDAGLWTDVSAYVTRVETDRGRQRLLSAFERGSCTVKLDNLSGLFSPHNTSSAYYPYVRPETRIRVRFVYGGTSYPVFHGFIDSIQPTWTGPTAAEVTIRATDGFKVLARFDPPAASSPVGEGEDTGARIGRLLDLAGWPDGDRDLDVGLSTLQATTMAQNTLTEVQLSADSEMGEVFMSADGKVTFRNRHARYERATSRVVQATFGDSSTYIEAEFGIPAYDDALVRNDVSVAATGGEAATSTDATSQSRYFSRTWNRHDLVFDGGDDESQRYADTVVYRLKDPEQRIDSISVRGIDSWSALWAAVLPLEIGYRVRGIKTPKKASGTVGDALDKQLFVEGVRWTIEPGNVFDVTFQTSSAATFLTSALIFDDATYGKFDTGTFVSY